MNIDILKQIDEWAAYGFYEAFELQWPRNFGMAYRRMYENMEVTVPDGRFLIPHEPLSNSMNIETHNKHHAEGRIFNFFHSDGLAICEDLINIKKQKYPQYS